MLLIQGGEMDRKGFLVYCRDGHQDITVTKAENDLRAAVDWAQGLNEILPDADLKILDIDRRVYLSKRQILLAIRLSRIADMVLLAKEKISDREG